MDLLQYTFFQNALLGSLFASIACGIIGTYIVTRRLVFIRHYARLIRWYRSGTLYGHFPYSFGCNLFRIFRIRRRMAQ